MTQLCLFYIIKLNNILALKVKDEKTTINLSKKENS